MIINSKKERIVLMQANAETNDVRNNMTLPVHHQGAEQYQQRLIFRMAVMITKVQQKYRHLRYVWRDIRQTTADTGAFRPTNGRSSLEAHADLARRPDHKGLK